MMSSSSYRTLLLSYLQGKSCMFCVAGRDSKEGKVFKCVFCQSAYHISCIGEAGLPPNSTCCTVEPGVNGDMCVYCGDTGGLYTESLAFGQQLREDKAHFVCRYLQRCITSKRLDTKTSSCCFCVEKYDPLFACSREGCTQSFHLSCLTKHRLCLPLPLMSHFGKHNRDISLHCSLHIDSSQKSVLEQYTSLQSKFNVGVLVKADIGPWERHDNSSQWEANSVVCQGMNLPSGSGKSTNTTKILYEEINKNRCYQPQVQRAVGQTGVEKDATPVKDDLRMIRNGIDEVGEQFGGSKLLPEDAVNDSCLEDKSIAEDELRLRSFPELLSKSTLVVHGEVINSLETKEPDYSPPEVIVHKSKASQCSENSQLGKRSPNLIASPKRPPKTTVTTETPEPPLATQPPEPPQASHPVETPTPLTPVSLPPLSTLHISLRKLTFLPSSSPTVLSLTHLLSQRLDSLFSDSLPLDRTCHEKMFKEATLNPVQILSELLATGSEGNG